MTIGPLRRLVGTLGLVALIPTVALLAAGRLSPEDAALRAIATFALVLVTGRAADRWLAGLATRFEREHEAADGPVVEAGHRRHTDAPAI